MEARHGNLKVIHGYRNRNIGQSHPQRLKFIAAVVGLAILLAGGARWSQPESGPAQGTVAPETPQAHAGRTATDYFPAQYVNRGTSVGEHIQAF